MKRAFHATSVEIDPESEFVGFTDGEATAFWLKREDRSEELAQDKANIWIQRDDQAHGGCGGLASIELRPGTFVARVDLSVARFMAPNEEFEITYDDEDGSRHAALTEVLAQLTRGYEGALSVQSGSGKSKVVPARPLKRAPELPRVKAAAALTLTTAKHQNWSAVVGASVDLTFVVESTGGPVHGLAFELGGPAITEGIVEAIVVQNERTPAAALTRTGSACIGALPHVRLKAGFAPADPNRRYDGRQPSAKINVCVNVLKDKQALLTVRVTPQNAQGTRGSALQGRVFRGLPA